MIVNINNNNNILCLSLQVIHIIIIINTSMKRSPLNGVIRVHPGSASNLERDAQGPARGGKNGKPTGLPTSVER